jgi:gluconolactonase
MAIAVHSEELRELVDEDAEIEQVATGFTFTEGPIWMADGSLHFSDMPADKRRRWHPDEGVTVLRDPSNKCNGMTLDNDGNLIVCEHVTSSVVRIDPDGEGGGREVLATHYQGKELNSPNDVIVHSNGAIYFSDPTFGRMPVFGVEREQDLAFQGVYRIPPGGGDLTLLVDDFVQPNGLCFSPDESLLYVNDTDRAHIRVFDVAADGTISNGRAFAEGIGTGELASGELVDGMKCDERGNVWVTGPKGVWVFAPSGEHLGVIEIPENVGNLHWGGPDWNWLFVPASTSVYRVKTKVSGRREPFMS